ncbi:MAG: transcriptional regulator [Bacteroidetes bacterium]|jgi:DNA-binding transcriptional ArsR family regulator|nr:transcriptional regulator [Bacteroidota bacterium]
MAKRSKPEFDVKAEEYSNKAKALGHPARIMILLSLQANNHQTCKELVSQLPFTQSTVSQHLYALVSAGFLESKGYKTSTIFSLKTGAIQDFQTLFQEVFGVRKQDRQLSMF